ncbi:type II and III secretion system protein family protein [Thalassobaculum sp.]|uniref:type II and III secretion system protein family protein n=1 Tax=Thalassobaculum sp. TaxID=2022740 RepID=UPI0032F03CBF
MTRPQLLAAVLAAVFVALATVPVHRAAAARVEVVDAASVALDVEHGKGRLLRFPGRVSTVFLADPNVADVQVKSPTMIYVLGKTVGETTLYGLGRDESLVASMTIRVTHNVRSLESLIRQSVANADVQVKSFEGSILVSGRVGTPEAAADVMALANRFTDKDNVINKLQVTQPTQVNLRVRMAEVSRSLLQRLGVNWEALFNNGSAIVGLATGNPVVSGGSFLTRQNGVDNIVGAFSRGNVDFNVIFDFLNEEGLVTLLAEPNLTAANGQKANFLAGGEFPIVVPQRDNLATIEFKEFGVSLEFTPTILGDNRISLHVLPEVSQLTTSGSVEINGFVIPALTKRRAETRVELASGQSFAIAGLLQETVDHGVRKLPGLGDLPVLGKLFTSDAYERGESELVIIVTPYLVRPADPTALQTPIASLPSTAATGQLADARAAVPGSLADAGGPRAAPLIGGTRDQKELSRRLAGPVGFILN